MVIRFGQQCAKLLVVARSPAVDMAGHFGWTAVPRVYGTFVVTCSALFVALTPSWPHPLAVPANKRPAAGTRRQDDVSILQMLISPPSQVGVQRAMASPRGRAMTIVPGPSRRACGATSYCIVVNP
jgi:hypothetical protein